MSVNVYTNFFISSDGCNYQLFKILNETWNMSSYIAEQFDVIPIATPVLLLAQEVKIL